MYLEQIYFLKSHWNVHPHEALIAEMEELLDGFGGILVASGVFFEERELLLRPHRFQYGVHEIHPG